MRKLFGKDGLKGIAGKTITTDMVMELGKTTACYLKKRLDRNPNIVLSADCSDNAKILSYAFAVGFSSCGGEAILLENCPSVCLYQKINELELDGGVMFHSIIGMSQNIGIRIYNNNGIRYTIEQEEDLEIAFSKRDSVSDEEQFGKITNQPQATAQYIETLKALFPFSFASPKRVLVYCENQHISEIILELIRYLGCEADLYSTATSEDNKYTENVFFDSVPMAEYVLEHQYDLGLLFNLSGSRALAIDDKGDVLDGEKLLALFSKEYAGQDETEQRCVLYPEKSNMGLFHFAREQGFHTEVAHAQDRSVIAKMREKNCIFGGGKNGYLIFPEYAYEGDGIYVAMRLLQMMYQTDTKMSHLSALKMRYPQVTISVAIRKGQREMWKNNLQIMNCVEAIEQEMSEQGRVLLTEDARDSKISVCVECREFITANEYAKRIVSVIEREVGIRSEDVE